MRGMYSGSHYPPHQCLLAEHLELSVFFRLPFFLPEKIKQRVYGDVIFSSSLFIINATFEQRPLGVTGIGPGLFFQYPSRRKADLGLWSVPINIERAYFLSCIPMFFRFCINNKPNTQNWSVRWLWLAYIFIWNVHVYIRTCANTIRLSFLTDALVLRFSQQLTTRTSPPFCLTFALVDQRKK